MAVTFKNYLINEIMVDIDPSDPESLTRVRQDLRTAETNPDKLRRMAIQKARDERKSVQQNNQGGPASALMTRIAQTKEYLAQLEQQLAKIQQTQANR